MHYAGMTLGITYTINNIGVIRKNKVVLTSQVRLEEEEKRLERTHYQLCDRQNNAEKRIIYSRKQP
ncbi:hypothetical protein CWC18_00530 [Pseudoalteromonas aurantia]|nr:hypothetical protein CWC18_00530 [Pseudoalteromonas aurantia]